MLYIACLFPVASICPPLIINVPVCSLLITAVCDDEVRIPFEIFNVPLFVMTAAFVDVFDTVKCCRFKFTFLFAFIVIFSLTSFSNFTVVSVLLLGTAFIAPCSVLYNVPFISAVPSIHWAYKFIFVISGVVRLLTDWPSVYDVPVPSGFMVHFENEWPSFVNVLKFKFVV